MSEKIKSEIKLVTPELAKTFLLSNEQNRRIRAGWVNYLAYCIRNNEWKVTHQGIAFSDRGRLLDGQHRLLAIVKADISAQLMISYNWDESVFSAIDNGIKRTDEDRTNINRKLAECAKFFLQIMDYAGFESSPNRDKMGNWGSRSTPAQIIAYSNVISDFNEILMKRSRTTTTVFSAVPCKCAAITSILLGDDIDYVSDLYRDLVLGKIEKLPPIARSALQQFITGTLTSAGGNEVRLDNFVRFLTLFRKKNENVQKLILRDRNERIAQVRKELMPWFVKKELAGQAGRPHQASAHESRAEERVWG